MENIKHSSRVVKKCVYYLFQSMKDKEQRNERLHLGVKSHLMFWPASSVY